VTKTDAGTWKRNLADNSQHIHWDLMDAANTDDRIGIVVGAGPSLDKNWDTLINLDRSRFFKIAVTTILPRFVSEGILPDYLVVTGEGDGGVIDFKGADMGRITTIMSTTANPVYRKIAKDVFFYNNRTTRIRDRVRQMRFPKVHHLNPWAPTATFHGIMAGLIISPRRPIAVVGMDLCVDDPNYHHCAGTHPIEEFPDAYRDQDHAATFMTNSYRRSLWWAEKWAKRHPDLVVNCTEGGAVQGLTKMFLSDFIK